MATMVLSAVGAAVGSSIGGGALGFATAVAGRAVGATIGATIDQSILGAGAAPVDVERVDRFRVMGSAEGAEIPRVFGRMRLSGQIIWSSRFLETVSSTSAGGSGKGMGGGQSTNTYSYSVSIAVALCEGIVSRIGQVWADGQAISLSGLNWRLYSGDEAQLPDPLIAAIEGVENAPAYRGTAYVVIEDIQLAAYGNRLPQLSFEVFRRPTSLGKPRLPDVAKAVVLGGTGGEYALSPEIQRSNEAKGISRTFNAHGVGDISDFESALDQLSAALPAVSSIAVPVSWYIRDLRCALAAPEPRVSVDGKDATDLPWVVSGVSRENASVLSSDIAQQAGLATPSDRVVKDAIQALSASGQAVLLRPELRLDAVADNSLEDPWTGLAGQKPFSPAGLLSASAAPSRTVSPDGTAAILAELSAFVGHCAAGDFSVTGNGVSYDGPAEWSYRRFILHYAHLAASAGGVNAFCVGVGLSGLTQLRDHGDSFPMVDALRALVQDVRSILGPDVKIGYAADWTEFSNYRPKDGSGDVYYNLDPLWTDPDTDFVGIENYMPISDWRDGLDHLDADWKALQAPGYFEENIEGGEGYDWIYETDAARTTQDRTAVVDPLSNEPWVYRTKDIRNWWARPHKNRFGGQISAVDTGWLPGMKPIWFTSLGIPGIDKGTNTPQAMKDPLFDASAPPFSNGLPDDGLSTHALEKVIGYWSEPAQNPVSATDGRPMLDLSRIYVNRWDVRPWPEVSLRSDIWADTDAVTRGHVMSARAIMVPVADVVEEICLTAGVGDLNIEAILGATKGYVIGGQETARQSLQPLMMRHGFDLFERFALLTGRSRSITERHILDTELLVDPGEKRGTLAYTRAPEAESPARVRVGYVEADRAYRTGAVEVRLPGSGQPNTSSIDLPVVLSAAEAIGLAERWLTEANVARDKVDLSLPKSRLDVLPGDLISPGGSDRLYRVDRIEDDAAMGLEAVRVDGGLYGQISSQSAVVTAPPPIDTVPDAPTIYAEFLDLPILTGNEFPHAPHVAVTSTPWPGSVAVYSASEGYGYVLNTEVERNATMGETLEPLPRVQPGVWANQSVKVHVVGQNLQSLPRIDVLNGGNVGALRNGSGEWEVFQFETAILTGPDEYTLGNLLRGQAGTDAFVPDVWPVDTDFVLLDGSAVQIALSTTARGLARHYRVGAASRPYDDPSYQHEIAAFDGVGLRPLSPVHLRARREMSGQITLSWTRRTRINGDSWFGTDVPLGETQELYVVRVRVAGIVRREEIAMTPLFSYPLGAQTADGAFSNIRFEVAQVSETYGPGAFGGMDFHE